MGDDFGQFVNTQAVIQCTFQMKWQLLQAVQRHQRGHRRQTAFTRLQLRTRPHVAKQYVVGQLGKLLRVVALLFPPRDYLCAHAVFPLMSPLTGENYQVATIPNIRFNSTHHPELVDY